ncbi:MAG: hypothetical protein AB7K63_04845 [Vicinamibacterales bacterium]
MTLLFVALAIGAAAALWAALHQHARAARSENEVAALHQQLEMTTLELQKATTELKSLSGLLPMCAWCKKIRDDAGYWQQLEGYLQSHTDVEFSHSMCPDCTQKIQADHAGCEVADLAATRSVFTDHVPPRHRDTEKSLYVSLVRT